MRRIAMLKILVIAGLIAIAGGWLLYKRFTPNHRARLASEIEEAEQTGACAAGERKIASIDVRASNFKQLVSGKATQLLFVQNDGCVRRGDVMPLSLIVREKRNDKIIYQIYGPEVEVTKIERMPVGALRKKTRKWIAKKMDSKQKEVRQEIVFQVTAEVPNPEKWNPPDQRPPLVHPLAQSWDGKAPEKYFIIDVRDRDSFTKGHFPGAYWVEVSPRSAAYAVKRPNELNLDFKFLNGAGGKPIVVIGQDLLDYRAYNMISALHEFVRGPLFYWSGGWDALHGFVEETPRALDGVKIIEPREALKADALWIDARNAYEAERTGRSMDTLVWSLREGRDQKSRPAYRQAKLDAAQILKVDRLAPLSSPPAKDTPLIVFARNSYDWRGPKLAAILRSKGYANLSWLRAGIEPVELISAGPEKGSGENTIEE